MGIKYNVNEDFFKTWSCAMSYVLGFITADGSLEDAAYLRGKYLRICSCDKEIIDKIKAAMDSEHTIVVIGPKEFVFKDKLYISKVKYMVRIGSHKIYTDLVKLGIMPNKSKKITLPDIPFEFMSHFIRGYLDGDGCTNIYYKKKRLSLTFTSGSRQFLEELSRQISFVLSNPSHRTFENSRAFQIKYSTKEAIVLLRYIYADISSRLYLERKYNLFLEFLQEFPKWQEYMAWYPRG